MLLNESVFRGDHIDRAPVGVGEGVHLRAARRGQTAAHHVVGERRVLTLLVRHLRQTLRRVHEELE